MIQSIAPSDMASGTTEDMPNGSATQMTKALSDAQVDSQKRRKDKKGEGVGMSSPSGTKSQDAKRASLHHYSHGRSAAATCSARLTPTDSRGTAEHRNTPTCLVVK